MVECNPDIDCPTAQMVDPDEGRYGSAAWLKYKQVPTGTGNLNLLTADSPPPLQCVPARMQAELSAARMSEVAQSSGIYNSIINNNNDILMQKSPVTEKIKSLTEEVKGENLWADSLRNRLVRHDIGTLTCQKAKTQAECYLIRNRTGGKRGSPGSSMAYNPATAAPTQRCYWVDDFNNINRINTLQPNSGTADQCMELSEKLETNPNMAVRILDKQDEDLLYNSRTDWEYVPDSTDFKENQVFYDRDMGMRRLRNVRVRLKKKPLKNEANYDDRDPFFTMVTKLLPVDFSQRSVSKTMEEDKIKKAQETAKYAANLLEHQKKQTTENKKYPVNIINLNNREKINLENNNDNNNDNNNHKLNRMERKLKDLYKLEKTRTTLYGSTDPIAHTYRTQISQMEEKVYALQSSTTLKINKKNAYVDKLTETLLLGGSNSSSNNSNSSSSSRNKIHNHILSINNLHQHIRHFLPFEQVTAKKTQDIFQSGQLRNVCSLDTLWKLYSST